MKDAGILIGLSLLIASAALFARWIGRLVSRADAAQQGRATVRPAVEPDTAEHPEHCVCDECYGGPDCTQTHHQPWCRLYRENEAAIPEAIIDDAEAERLRELRTRETDPAPMQAIQWPPAAPQEGNGSRVVSGEIKPKGD